MRSVCKCISICVCACVQVCVREIGSRGEPGWNAEVRVCRYHIVGGGWSHLFTCTPNTLIASHCVCISVLEDYVHERQSSQA